MLKAERGHPGPAEETPERVKGNGLILKATAPGLGQWADVAQKLGEILSSGSHPRSSLAPACRPQTKLNGQGQACKKQRAAAGPGGVEAGAGFPTLCRVRLWSLDAICPCPWPDETHPPPAASPAFPPATGMSARPSFHSMAPSSPLAAPLSPHQRLSSPRGTTPPRALPPSPRAPELLALQGRAPAPAGPVLAVELGWLSGDPLCPRGGARGALASALSPTPVHVSLGGGPCRPRRPASRGPRTTPPFTPQFLQKGTAPAQPRHLASRPQPLLGAPWDQRERLEAFGLLEHGMHASETGGSWSGPDTGVRPRHCELGTPHWPGPSAWLLLGG